MVESDRAGGPFFLQLLHISAILVPYHAFVPAAHQTAHHVGAHTSQTDHPKLHSCSPPLFRVTDADRCWQRRVVYLLPGLIAKSHTCIFVLPDVNWTTAYSPGSIGFIGQSL